MCAWQAVSGSSVLTQGGSITIAWKLHSVQWHVPTDHAVTQNGKGLYKTDGLLTGRPFT